MAIGAESYAARLDIDFPEQLDRLTTFLRVIWIIPIGIILSLLTATGNETVVTQTGERISRAAGDIRRPLGRDGADDRVPAAVPALVVRLRPRADALRGAGRRLPGPAHGSVPLDRRGAGGASGDRLPRRRARPNRWLPLVKWLLAIPHYLVLVVLWLVAIVAVVVAWFAILVTGRYPRALFGFVVELAGGACESTRTLSCWSPTATRHSVSTKLKDRVAPPRMRSVLRFSTGWAGGLIMVSELSSAEVPLQANCSATAETSVTVFRIAFEQSIGDAEARCAVPLYLGSTLTSPVAVC